jgi:carboxy-terminal domain RNA polymerase II polypeptide A small phosphatase
VACDAMQPPLLLLDLDETLIHSMEAPLERACDFRTRYYHVYRRPFLAPFLDYCFRDYQVALWTAGSEGYAREIVPHIIPAPERLAFLWSAERCTRRFDPETGGYSSLKNLRKVRRRGYPLERVLMVDDSPENLERNYGNHIHITPFQGDPADIELSLLRDYLEMIRDQPNFRAIEKRFWRDEVRGRRGGGGS